MKKDPIQIVAIFLGVFRVAYMLFPMCLGVYLFRMPAFNCTQLQIIVVKVIGVFFFITAIIGMYFMIMRLVEDIEKIRKENNRGDR